MGIFSKIGGGIMALLAVVAAFFKIRSDHYEEEAEQAKDRADRSEAREKRRKATRKKQSKIDKKQAERRKEENKAKRKGRRTGLDNTWSFLLAAFLVMLVGCGTTPVAMEPPLCPERPVLPRLTAEDLACLTDEAYDRLFERSRLRREYAEDLEAFCRRPADAD